MCVPICECCKSIKLNTDIQVISGHSSVMKLTYYLELETVCFNVSCAPNLKTVKTKQGGGGISDGNRSVDPGNCLLAWIPVSKRREKQTMDKTRSFQMNYLKINSST